MKYFLELLVQEMNNRADSRLKMEQNVIILIQILLSRALKKY